MALQKEEKEQILQHFRRNELDTGSSEIQIALLTFQIRRITEHFQRHKKDFNSRTGLVTMVNQRRKLLDYLKKTDLNKYSSLIEKLDIRK